MKNLVLLFVLVVSTVSFAQEKRREWDLDEEKACHKEYKTYGCVDKQDQEITNCIDKNLTKVSSKCRSMHTEKKDKK